MRCKIVFFTTLLFFSFQSVTVVGLTHQNSQLFPTCFLDEVLSLERDANSRNFSHLFLHPVNLLNRNDRLLIFQGDFEDVYHQKRGGENYHEIWLKNNRVTAILPLQEGFLKANFAFGFADEGFKLKIPSEPRYDLDFDRDKSFAQLIYAKRLFSPLVQIGIGTKTLEISGKRFWDHSYEVALSPFERIKFGLTHRNLNINYFLKLFYEDSFMDLPVNLVSEENDWYFNFDLISDMQFCLNYQEAKLKENQKLSRQADFFLDPGGDVFSFSGRLNFKLCPDFQIHFGQKKNYLKGRGDLYYLNQKFGKVTSIKIIEEGAFGGVSFDIKKKHFFKWEVEVVRITGEGKGHIQTWPFTPTLVDLLGQRLYFRLNGEAEILRLGLEYHRPEFGFLSLGTRSSIDYLSIRPSGKAVTWNPVFLVFGITNLKEYFLKYQRIDGLLLRLGFGRRFKNLSLNYNFFQFIPIHTKTRNIDEEKSNGNTPANLIKKSTRGGRTHMFSLCYHLP